MLPHAYEGPAAILLVLGGALSGFAGYRLFRIVLGIYGFILGAMLASSIMGATDHVGMIVASIVGGLLGAALLSFGYFVGIALVGAGLGALIAHVAWTQYATGDPRPVVVVVVSVVGAIVALLLQRYVIIIGTAFGGAWMMIVGALALAGDHGAAGAASARDVWILYPFAPMAGQRWVPIVWVAIGIISTAVQLGAAGRKH